jgi:hypothetical protein
MGSYGHINENSFSIKIGKFFEKVSDYQLLKTLNCIINKFSSFKNFPRELRKINYFIKNEKYPPDI